mmetsp:Transcript_830/g.1004  ORF Transcript_830/g.1004 Transcript_830/m.1004 type:complete len:440 (+) Transcript_830:61-1380(+)
MGNILELDHVTEKASEHGTAENGQVQYSAVGMKGWRVTMEDCHTLCNALPVDGREEKLEDHSLFAVYDGHGGSLTSQYAGENFLRIFSNRSELKKYAALPLQGRKSRDDVTGIELLKNALTKTFKDLDTELRIAQSKRNEDIAKEEEEKEEKTETCKISSEESILRRMERSGSTCVVVMLTPSHILCANAGDSRAILRKDGKALPLSFDHKPPNLPEQERIIAAGGFVKAKRVDGDLAVSRGLGDFAFKSEGEFSTHRQKVIPIPDIITCPRDTAKDEFIIIACDGIWDVISNSECSDMVQSILDEGETNITMVCEEILDTCLERNSRDNMTLVMVCLPGVKMSQKNFSNGAVVMKRRTARQARILETQAKITAQHTAKSIKSMGLDFGSLGPLSKTDNSDKAGVGEMQCSNEEGNVKSSSGVQLRDQQQLPTRTQDVA